MEVEEIRAILPKMVKSVNAHIQQIRAYTGKKESYAMKKLKSKLTAKPLDETLWTEKGFVKYNKKLSDSDVKALYKAVKSFKESKTGTVKGIKAVELERKGQIAEYLKSQQDFGNKSIEDIMNENKISQEDAEDMFNLFDDEGILNWVNDNDIDWSSLFAIMGNLTKEMPHAKLSDFKEKLASYNIQANNTDAQRSIRRLWTKFIK